MAYSLGYRFKKREYTKFVRTELFPPIPKHFKSLCIGTKSRNLGDALVLTPLFSKLATHYPDLSLSSFIRAFNPVVLENHPLKLTIKRGPKILFGDDINTGGGHLIAQKLRSFDLPFQEDEIRPEIHLSPSEIVEAKLTLQQLFKDHKNPKDLWVIHPWGKTWSSLMDSEAWSEVLKSIPRDARILQVGLPGETAIPGAEFYAIDPSHHGSARRLFAIIREAQHFIGVDSGPMHIATAFRVPSLILIKSPRPGMLIPGLEMRNGVPYFHPLTRPFANLYDSNSHVEIDQVDFKQAVHDWIESQA